jgi:uncharacterized protein (DUF433 family)
VSIITGYEHIVLNENQVPVIAGTTMKVVELITSHKAYGWSPEELHFQHPYLSMAQVYSALAYYWDHKDEIEQDIINRMNEADELRKLFPVSELEKQLRSHVNQ